VATSGNVSDEPICIEEHEAVQRLRGVADVFLVHDRPIIRHVDDSVARILMGREQVLRRARGYAPLPIQVRSPECGVRHESVGRAEANSELRTSISEIILAVGAHLKNTVALRVGNDIFLSQHIGDLETPPAIEAFRRVVADFERLYEATPELVACDLHPEYLSTKQAKEMGVPLAPVQHHYAHIAACMAENEIAAPVLGVSWDGTGYGLDGTIWGGEFLRVNESSFQRYAHLRTFRLPGGEAAIKQPRRAALGLLREIFGEAVFQRQDLAVLADFAPNELALVRQALARGVNSPVTSSAGRLFDAVAALLGLCPRVHFEGQAAMELEYTIQRGVEDAYRFELKEETSRIVDWQPMILQVLDDILRGVPAGLVAAKFHNTLVEMIVAVARLADLPKVVLSGGCFQNKYLLERTVRRLQAEDFRPYWHQRVPPNDGGIALGQVVAAVRARQPKPQLEEALLV
jgi:hydrogenase maturation protein HypF